MIYIAVALGVEARPIVRYFNLKRDSSIKKFQVFKNDKITLIVTGAKIVKALAGSVHVLTLLEPKVEDIFINIGVVGAVNREKFRIGDIVLAHKVMNSNGNLVFYPDMNLEHSFKEGVLESFDYHVQSADDVIGDIVDMEGAGLAEGAGYFFKTSQIFFIKIVSDYLENEIEPSKIEDLIDSNIDIIYNWVERILAIFKEKKESISVEEMECIDKLINILKLSETMGLELKGLMKYYKLKNGNIISLLEDYQEIEIKDKRGGKKVFDEIKKQVIE